MAESAPSPLLPAESKPPKMVVEEHHHHHLKPATVDGGRPYSRYYVRNPRHTISSSILGFLILAALIALIVWLVYRPNDPKFTVVGAAIYDFNVSSPPLMSTTMQFTVTFRNPNRRTAMYYDDLSAFVEYKNQIITPPVILPPIRLGHKSTMAMSPVLGGEPIPVSPEVANGLTMDQSYGVVGLRLVVIGKVKYKAGAIKTRRYGIYVKCDVLLGMKTGFVGQVPLLGSQDSQRCDVDV